MDLSVLEEIGLSKAEIKVYLALLGLGPVRAGPIIKKAGIQSSVFYNAAHNLLDKGLLTYIKKGKIKYYQANNPENIVEYIEEKKKRFEELLPELLLEQKPYDSQTAEVFVGIKGVKAAFMTINKDLKKHDFYYAFIMEEQFKNKEIVNFILRLDNLRHNKGIQARLISNMKYRDFFKRQYTKTKAISLKYTNIDIPMGLAITKNHLLLLTWGESPNAFLISSKELTKRFKIFFEDVWNSSKK